MDHALSGDRQMHGSNESEQLIWNRRGSERVRCCGERLLWKGENARRNRRGWLNDVSAQGVSFLIEQRRKPVEGETVEVRTDKHGDPMSYRVIRVTPEGVDLALVACERSSSAAPALAQAA